MSFIFLIFIILSLALCASNLLKKSIALTIPLSIISIISVLYLFFVINILTSGFFFIIVLSVISFALYIYLSIKKDKQSLKKLYSPPVIIFTIISFIIYLGTKNLNVSIFDEFSHWSLIVKNLFYFNSLGDSIGATVEFKDYPPAIALFQYFCTRLTSSFNEGALYTSKGIFYVSLMMITLKDHSWKEVGQILLKALLIIVLPILFFNYFYQALYVDGLLSALFAYIIILSFIEKPSTFLYINIALSMFVITLAKPSGLGIGLIALVIFYIIMLKSKSEKLSIKSIVKMLSPVIAIFIAYFSWKIFVSLKYSSSTADSIVIKYQEIINVLSGNHKGYQYDTVVAFAKFLTNNAFTTYSIRLYYTSFLAIFGLIGTFFVFTFENAKDKSNRKIVALGIIIGLIAYTASILFLYLFSFTESEAVALAACQRYLSTYFMGAMLSFLFLILLNKKNLFSILISLLIIMLINFSPLMELTILSKVKSASTKIAMQEYEDIKNIESKLDYKTNKVFFLDLDATHSGYQYWVAKYYFTPININSEGSWRIGESYYENDQYTYNIDKIQWSNILIEENYTHIYIFEASDKFKLNFGELFKNGATSVQSKSLYAVKKTENSIIIEKVN